MVPPATSASALAERYSPAPMDRPSASTVEMPMTSVSAGDVPPEPATAARSANVVRIPSMPPNTMPRMCLWSGTTEWASAGFKASSGGDAHSFCAAERTELLKAGAGCAPSRPPPRQRSAAPSAGLGTAPPCRKAGISARQSRVRPAIREPVMSTLAKL